MAGGAAGPAGSTGTTGTTGATQQYNTGSNWANPVQGTAWQNPTTGSPYMGVGSQSPTGAMTYQPPTSYSQMPTPYGDLNNPANAAGRRQQAIDQSTQTATQATMKQQLPNSTGMGGYGYGPGYNPQGGFGYNPQGGIAGLYGAMGMNPQQQFMNNVLSGQTATSMPGPGNLNVEAARAMQQGDTFQPTNQGWGGSFGQIMNQVQQQAARANPQYQPRAYQAPQLNQAQQNTLGSGFTNTFGGGAPTSFGPSYGK